MAFSDVLKNGAKKLFGSGEEGEELDDDETRDKFLRSLRRQRRVQLEELEKEQLKKEIAAHQQMRTREAYFNPQSSDKLKREKLIFSSGSKRRRSSSMMDKGSLLRAKKRLKKRASKGLMGADSDFLR